MKIKKRILISILLILIILSTNIAVTLAATKSELQAAALTWGTF